MAANPTADSYVGVGSVSAGWFAPAAPSPSPPPAPTPPSPPPPPPPPAPPPPVGTVLDYLQVEELGGQSGTFYQCFSFQALEGSVPAGTVLVSPDSGALTSTVISTHADGSARVLVGAFPIDLAANQAKTIRVQAGNPPSGAVLTAARIVELAPQASVEFSGGLSATVALPFASAPTRVWWATPGFIEASWTVPVPGHASLCVVFHVRAWSGVNRVRVRVMVENSLVNMASPQNYTSATYSAVVSVGGVTVATVSSSVFPEGNHPGTRAWMAMGWIGGSQNTRARMSCKHLQKLPQLWRYDRDVSTVDLDALYGSDSYAPASSGRQRASGMGDGGDHPSIGPLPQWECRALQTGNKSAWRATEVSTEAVLSYNINYRAANTGLVPDFASIGTRWQTAGWPRHVPAGLLGGVLGWETAHRPAAGMMAFFSDPCPMYVEIAQKTAVWDGTWSASNNPPGYVWTAGVFGRWYQPRGRGWGIRGLLHAILVSPSSHPFVTPAIEAISKNVDYLTAYHVAIGNENSLQQSWDINSSGQPFDVRPDKVGFQIDWTHYYLIPEVQRVVASKVLSGTPAQNASSLSTWLLRGIVKWVEQQPNGGWRYVPSRLTIGTGASGVGGQATWELERGRADNHPGSPPTARGTWMSSSDQNECPLTYGEYFSNSLAVYYPSYYFVCLVAAVDQGVAGAREAMDTVLDGLTNLDAWRNTFSNDPRWGAFPRVYSRPAFTALGSGADTGSFSNDVLTPGRDSRGRMNAASWALVPANRWIRVANTDIQQLDAIVKARIPDWQPYGNETGWGATLNNYNGAAHDDFTARYWLMNAGGHNGGANNGIYGFDAIRMDWWIERMPSDTRKWSLRYRNRTGPDQPDTYTYCFESAQARDAEILAGTATPFSFAYDEIYWDNPGVPGGNTDEVGVPTSEHTYSACIYNAQTNELIKCGRGQRLWRYNRDTGKYTYKRILNDNPAGFSGAGGVLVLNEQTQVFTRAAAADGLYGSIAFDLNTNNWVAGGLPWASFWPPSDTRWGSKVTVVIPPTNGGPANINGKYWVYDAITGQVDTTGNLQLSGGLVYGDFVNLLSYFDGAGLVYIPPINRYWLCTRGTNGVDGMRWFEINPTTTPWTITRKEFAEGTTPTPDLQMMKKMFWVPTLNAVMLIDRYNQNVLFYKF